LIGCLIVIVGEDVPIAELADSIYAAQTEENENGFCEYDASNSDQVLIHPPIVIGSMVLDFFYHKFYFLLGFCILFLMSKKKQKLKFFRCSIFAVCLNFVFVSAILLIPFGNLP
jgi:hypothetical protein